MSVLGTKVQSGLRTGILWGAIAAGAVVLGGIALMYASPVLGIATNLIGGWTTAGALKLAGGIGAAAFGAGFLRSAMDPSIEKEAAAEERRNLSMQRNAVNRQLEQEREQMASLGIGGGFSPGNIPQRQGGLSRDNT